jgi:hypothetical protein
MQTVKITIRMVKSKRVRGRPCSMNGVKRNVCGILVESQKERNN